MPLKETREVGHSTPDHSRKYQVQSGGRRGARGKPRPWLLVAFLCERLQGRAESSQELAHLNNFCRFGAMGMVSSCLVPGPTMTQGKGTVGLVCERKMKWVAGRKVFGLVGRHLKATLLAEPFAVSESRLALAEAVFPQPARVLKCQNSRESF